jgi:hypothetical protein
MTYFYPFAFCYRILQTTTNVMSIC